MKNINFIKPLPPKQTSAIKTWFISSILLGSSLIVCLGVITGQEYLALRSLKNEKEQLRMKLAAFESTMQRKQELKKQEQVIKEKLQLITNAFKQTQQHALLMAHIKKSLKDWAKLESITIEPAGMQLCIDCTQTQQASEIISSLAQMPYITGLHMSSLQPKQRGTTTALRLNLRGTIKPS